MGVKLPMLFIVRFNKSTTGNNIKRGEKKGLNERNLYYII